MGLALGQGQGPQDTQAHLAQCRWPQGLPQGLGDGMPLTCLLGHLAPVLAASGELQFGLFMVHCLASIRLGLEFGSFAPGTELLMIWESRFCGDSGRRDLSGFGNIRFDFEAQILLTVKLEPFVDGTFARCDFGALGIIFDEG